MTTPTVIDFDGVLDLSTQLFDRVMNECGFADGFSQVENSMAQAAALEAAQRLVGEGLDEHERTIARAVGERLWDQVGLVPELPAPSTGGVEVVEPTKELDFVDHVYAVLRAEMVPIVNRASANRPHGRKIRLAYAIAALALAEKILQAYDMTVAASARETAQTIAKRLSERQTDGG